jgi:hypothetical protein
VPAVADVHRDVSVPLSELPAAAAASKEYTASLQEAPQLGEQRLAEVLGKVRRGAGAGAALLGCCVPGCRGRQHDVHCCCRPALHGRCRC